MAGPESSNWFVIITGMSGAGKTQAAHYLEDLGFYCVDNLPPNLLGTFGDLAREYGDRLGKTALVVDIRGGELFDHFFSALEDLRQRHIPYVIIFLEAADEVLMRRFKETRRRHPIAQEGFLLEGIRRERERLEDLREAAHHIIDTSHMAPQELKGRLLQVFAASGVESRLPVTLLSFGFKYGLPLDADMVLDARFLPNPHYDQELRPLPGYHPRVKEAVLKAPEARDFVHRVSDLILDYLPFFEREGKSGLSVAIGCTGGRHRSVAIVLELYRILGERQARVGVEHRDVARGRSGL